MQFEPIGYVRCGKQLKFETPHQPKLDSNETNRIVLEPDRQFDLALQDLNGFERIWVLSWFNRNQSWRPRPLPPRGPAKRRGVFATRSPHRPNPIGLTCVPLLDVDGLVLTVGPLDLVDGTPVLDIKPYIRTIDAFPDSKLGWIGEVEETLLNSRRFGIEVSAFARRQLDWLQNQWGIDFTGRAFELLSLDPTPHRTRRILQMGPNEFRMACGPWRLFFHLQDECVIVDRIDKGYSDESLMAEGNERIPDRDAQVAFGATYR